MTDFPAIPDFLLVRNRPTMTAAEDQAIRARFRVSGRKVDVKDRVRTDLERRLGFSLPKTLEPAGVALAEAMIADRARKARERLDMLRASKEATHA